MASGYACRLLVFGECPVDAGQARVLPLALAGRDDQVWADVLDGLAAPAAPEHGVQHVVGDDRWPAAVVSLAGGGVEAFEGGFADVLAFGFGHGGEEREQHPAGAGRVVDPGQRPGEHLQGDAVRGEVIGQRGQLGGVAAESFHLVDGEDDPAVRGVGLDLPGGLEGGLELRANPHAGGDLLGEDLVAGNAVCGEGVELGLEFLGQVRAAGVADADVRARCVRRDGCRRWGARPPRLSGSAVGGGRDTQFLCQARDFGEPAGVVGRGDGSGAGPARRAGLDLAPRAGVPLDLIGIGHLDGIRLGIHPGILSQTSLRTGTTLHLSENWFMRESLCVSPCVLPGSTTGAWLLSLLCRSAAKSD